MGPSLYGWTKELPSGLCLEASELTLIHGDDTSDGMTNIQNEFPPNQLPNPPGAPGTFASLFYAQPPGVELHIRHFAQYFREYTDALPLRGGSAFGVPS